KIKQVITANRSLVHPLRAEVLEDAVFPLEIEPESQVTRMQNHVVCTDPQEVIAVYHGLLEARKKCRLANKLGAICVVEDDITGTQTVFLQLVSIRGDATNG